MREHLQRRIRASKGEIPFDSLIKNVKIINTYTKRVIENGSVGIIDGVIASVCPSFSAKASKIFDGKGMYLAPSFVDAHMHIASSRLHPSAYAEAAIPHGTGCIMTDPMQLVNATGDDGIFCFMEMLQDLPLRSFLQFPSRVPAAKGMEHSGAFYSPEDTIDRMEKATALTLGEVNGASLLDSDTFEKLLLATESGFMINGHCPNFSRDELMSAAAACIRDDHESETFEDLLDRLYSGISVMIREGTIEPNCRELIRGVVRENIATDQLMFCTDDKAPEDIVKNGCIDHCIRIAISEGLDPIEAICMATLHPAKHFHLEDKMGVIAPGRFADFVLISNLKELCISHVFYSGKLVATDGKMIQQIERKLFPALLGTVHLPKDLRKKDLSPKEGAIQTAITMTPGSLLTKKKTVKVSIDTNHMVMADVENDILPIAVIDRYTGKKHIGTAMIQGLGIKKGAVASSCAQEGNNVVVSGTNYDDMLTAVKEVERIGGGNVVVIDGTVVGVRSLPLGGIISNESLEDSLRASAEFQKALSHTGSCNPMLMAMLTVSLCPSIPEIGLTDLGLIENGKILM